MGFVVLRISSSSFASRTDQPRDGNGPPTATRDDGGGRRRLDAAGRYAGAVQARASERASGRQAGSDGVRLRKV